MILHGVVSSIRPKKNNWLIGGYFIDDGSADSAIALLQFEERTLGQTVAARRGDRRRLTFRFTLSAGLGFLLAPRSAIEVVCGGVRAAFSERANAARTAFADDAEALGRFRRRLDLGEALTRKGRLRSPLRMQRKTPPTIAHYLHCDETLRTLSGYEIHVVGGTALGLLRDGGPIGHDNDFDAAYLSRFSEPADVKREFIAIVTALIERGEDVRVSRWARGRNFVKWFSPPIARSPARPYIDLFPAFIDADGFYCRPTFVRIPGGREMILPLRRMSFDGVEVRAPARLEEKVVKLFGPDWRIPDVSWRKPRLAGAAEALAQLRLSEAEMRECERLHAQHASLRRRIGRRRQLAMLAQRLRSIFSFRGADGRAAAPDGRMARFGAGFARPVTQNLDQSQQ